jgi:hypothetical protein
MAVRAIRMDARDNVAVVTTEVKPGDLIELDDGTELPLTPVAAGATVIRYGETIGLATEDIAVGQHVHTHNLGGMQ